ncbi:MAG: asparagine synthase (glutamine-hydrolyzing) [Phycisphaerales bacterium]|nr:asparagine synthase (glutamine-hydrolyzing) [Phycisphaerales bacterium]
MCGLGAILSVHGPAIPDDWLDVVDDRIVHRGPDGRGRFRDRVDQHGPDGTRTIHVALVHRRLAILDRDGGAQPMVSPRGRSDAEDLVAVVFNGCIYNHRDLRAELAAAGHRFTTDHSDTEVLVHGWREWGTGLGARLEGMYAFVVWDRAAATLHAARDWFGEKPLHHLETPVGAGRLEVIGSDAASVAEVGRRAVGETFAPDRRWVQRYLQLGYAPAGVTAFARPRTVVALPPSLPPSPSGASGVGASGSPDEVASHFESRLDVAVRRRLEADVPLGCFLSGGVDSGLIAHFASRHLPALRTFSVRMPDARYDESGAAARTAAHLGTDHTTLDVAMDPASDLVAIIHELGQPFGDSSILPTTWVSRAARKHVTVVLSGDGGDELFYGYERYLAASILARRYGWLRRVPRAFGAAAHPKSRRHKLGRLAGMARDASVLGPLAMESLCPLDLIAALTGGAVEDPVTASFGDDPAASLRDADLRGSLPGDMLTKVDAASMSVALEVRCPFLDRDVVAAARATDRRVLMREGRKGVLRRLARRHLPPEIAERPKMGFAVPLGEWFRSSGGLRTLLCDTLRDPAAFGGLPIASSVVQRLLDEHLAGRARHEHRLFALLTLSIWQRRFGARP